MTTARIFYNGMSSQELHANLERQTPGMRAGEFKGVRFVTDDSYQFAFFLNDALPVLTPPERNACFVMEPPDKFRPTPHPAIGTLFSFNPADRETFGARCVLRPMLSFLHAGLIGDDGPPPSRKSRLMSMVVSGKTDLPYQAKRREFADALIRSGLPIDFYGRDFPPNAGDLRIKGPLPRLDKTAALRDYTYSIACENSPFPGYLSEKFLDCVVNHCIPITNNPTPAGHFPSGSFIQLDFSPPVSDLVARIAEIIERRPAPDDGAVMRAKQEILHGRWSLAQAMVDFIAAATPTRNPAPHARQNPGLAMPTQRPPPPRDSPRASMPVPQTNQSPQGPPALQPLLSVLFLSCKRLHYLRRTVAAIRAHLVTVEPDIPAVFLCFDNGSSATDRQALAGMGFDLLTLSERNLGIGPAMNHLVSQVRTPFLLNCQDDWAVENPSRVPFLRESMRIMGADQRIAHIKLDACHFLEFGNRQVYDGPFRLSEDGVPFYCQNPRMLWGGFCFPPALTRVAALHELGPFREDRPFQRGWAESEYTQRYATKFLVAKSPAMVLFQHIGVDSTTGWDGEAADKAAAPAATTPTYPEPKTAKPNASGPKASAPKAAKAATPSIAFVIPYREDSPERAANLVLVKSHLEACIRRRGWSAEIVVGEDATPVAPGDFCKARLVNAAVRRCARDLVALIDADVLVPEEQLAQAIGLLADGADVVHPFRDYFLNVPRELIPGIRPDAGIQELFAARLENLNPSAVGGAIIFRTPVFWAGGGLNEHFISWGREDVELHQRFVKLGYDCRRVAGPIFHLDHPRTVDSRPGHARHAGNIEECARIEAMNAAELLDEIGSWPWAQQ